jgi:hypothetical protein
MPPQMIGGYVAGPVVIARSDRAVVAVRQVLAFPVGVQVDVEAHGRGPSLRGASAARTDPASDGGLRFRLRFSDGREAAQDDDAGLRGGRGPTLMASGTEESYGGPHNREDIRLSLWAWPLPAPGPLILTCTWSRLGLLDASLVLDGAAVLAAARDAEPFWPVPGE